MKNKEIVVCLGLPVFHDDRFVARLRALGNVEPLLLPIDPGGDWVNVGASAPFPEPPPWAESVAAQRVDALARANVLVALHSPDRLAERAPHLDWIQSIGAGVEQFLAAGAHDRVQLTNASGVSAGSMAEWVVGRLLQVWKRFRETDAFQQQRAFTRSYGRTFAGSTVGIVGLGSIGRAVAERLRPFGCRVLGLRRSARPGDSSPDTDALFAPQQLHEMLEQCDAAIIAAPATPDTHHLIGAEALGALPRHAVLVNVARGSLVDEAALAEVMGRGELAAAVLDVFEKEPLPEESPLWDLPNVYISAHSSVSVDTYMDDVFNLFVDNLQRYLAGELLQNRVDMQAMGSS